MLPSAILARGRALAESLMVDSCAITRAGGETTDPDTGVITPGAATDVYSGRCRVQQKQAQASPQDPGEAYVLMLRLEVQLPMSVVGLQVDDRIEITASAHDPDLVGRVFSIRDLMHKSHATSRRVGCQELTS